ncbi:MAG: alanine dehydrogenase [Salibacteraceae bacterium]
MMTSKETLRSLSQSAVMLPQEQMVMVEPRQKRLFFGIPKETSFQENRVALVPEAVSLLVQNGHEVVVETNAGKASNYSDNDYSEAGAQIAYTTEDVYKAGVIMKVAPPSMEEIDYLQPRQILISALQLTVQPKDFVKRLMDKKVTAIAWDYIQDEEGLYPVVSAMGEIAGNTSILIAAEYLSNTNQGQGAMFGGITGLPPTEVVIIGAGTVGGFAARTALGLGASVKVFDNSITKLRRLTRDLGGVRVYTSTIQPKILRKALQRTDVAIGAVRAPHGRTPSIVTEEMVGSMKSGSVIVDVSIDQGGCFETSQVTNHDNPVYVKYDVIHYCVPNIASRVSKTASKALSNIFAPILVTMGTEGGIENVLRKFGGVRNGIYLYNGTLTNRYLGETFNLPFSDLDLLMAAF